MMYPLEFTAMQSHWMSRSLYLRDLRLYRMGSKYCPCCTGWISKKIFINCPIAAATFTNGVLTSTDVSSQYIQEMET